MSPSSRNESPPDVGVLIAAGGRGVRAGQGELKQFRPIAGVPMLLRAVRPFAQHPRVLQIVVALPEPQASRPPEWLAELVGERLVLVAGGDTRAASVRNALAALDPAAHIVLVHDAARPLVSTDTVERVLDAVSEGVGVVPAIPVSETIKRADTESGRVMETVDRRGLWQARTPQGFPRELLEQAFDRVGSELSPYTDEAAILEATGLPVRVVPDKPSNIKVTTPEDFLLVELLAGR